MFGEGDTCAWEGCGNEPIYHSCLMYMRHIWEVGMHAHTPNAEVEPAVPLQPAALSVSAISGGKNPFNFVEISNLIIQAC